MSDAACSQPLLAEHLACPLIRIELRAMTRAGDVLLLLHLQVNLLEATTAHWGETIFFGNRSYPIISYHVEPEWIEIQRPLNVADAPHGSPRNSSSNLGYSGVPRPVTGSQPFTAENPGVEHPGFVPNPLRQFPIEVPQNSRWSHRW